MAIYNAYKRENAILDIKKTPLPTLLSAYARNQKLNIKFMMIMMIIIIFISGG